MPTRRTTRGAERTPLAGDYDVLVCGASFAGLAVARELTGSGARVLVIDRYEIGERQTSACGIPTEWLRAMDLMGAHRQTFGRLVVHTPFGTSVVELPWTLLHLRLPDAMRAACGPVRRTSSRRPRSTDAPGNVVHTDRGDLSAPLIVDALGWRRVLGSGYQPPDAPLSRGLEVHPWGAGDDMELWIDRKYVPAGYGWSFPAGEEVRVGVGSFDPRFHVKDTTVMLAAGPRARARPLPGQLDPAPPARGHRRRRLLRGRLRRPLPPAHCRGNPHRPLLRDRLRARAARRDRGPPADRLGPDPLRRLPRGPPPGSSRCCSPVSAWSRACRRACSTARIGAMQAKRFVDWSFGHYLNIAPPCFATATASSARRRSGARMRSSATWGFGGSQSSLSPSSAQRSQRAQPPSRV